MEFRYASLKAVSRCRIHQVSLKWHSSKHNLKITTLAICYQCENRLEVNFCRLISSEVDPEHLLQIWVAFYIGRHNAGWLQSCHVTERMKKSLVPHRHLREQSKYSKFGSAAQFGSQSVVRIYSSCASLVLVHFCDWGALAPDSVLPFTGLWRVVSKFTFGKRSFMCVLCTCENSIWSNK